MWVWCMTAAQGEGAHTALLKRIYSTLFFCLLCKNSLGLTYKKQVRKEKHKEKVKKPQQNWCRQMCCSYLTGNSRWKIHPAALKQDLHPRWTRCTSWHRYTNWLFQLLGFLPQIPARKGVFTPLFCYFMHHPSETQPLSFLLAPALSPAWPWTVLQFLLLSITQEDYDTSWQDTGRCWSEVGLCLQFLVFEIREPAHSFIADIIYLTTVSCKRAEHSKAQKEGLNFSSNWCPSPEQFRRLNTHVNKLCWVPEEIWSTKELAEEVEGEKHRI